MQIKKWTILLSKNGYNESEMDTIDKKMKNAIVKNWTTMVKMDTEGQIMDRIGQKMNE